MKNHYLFISPVAVLMRNDPPLINASIAASSSWQGNISVRARIVENLLLACRAPVADCREKRPDFPNTAGASR
jgi:hypothetical protein